MIPFDTKKTVAACLTALYAMNIASNAHAAPAVPEGFESITAGYDERIDILFLGESLGLFRVFVTPETLRFEEPEEVLKAVSAKIASDADTSAILAALSVPMSRNGNLTCTGHPGVNGCGYIDTEAAAVIYNESDGNLDLFLSKDWLGSEEGDQRLRVASPMSDNALIHQQTINVASGRGYKSVAVSGTGALGITKKSFIGGNWNFTHTSFSHASNSRAELRDIYYRHDIGAQHYVQAGRMDSRNLASTLGGNFGFSMLPVGTLDGVRVGTTLAYLNPDSADLGTPVTVLLSRDSRIDAYRGSELLGTFYMRAGVNSLDTSRFPEGTYPLLLRIFENDVLSRMQTAPFTKTGGGIGLRTRQWFVQAGRSADRKATDKVNATAGIRFPVANSLSVTTGVASVDGGTYGETEFDWRHALGRGMLSASTTLAIGDNGTRGSTQQISFSNSIAWSVYRYRMRGAACDGKSISHRDIGCYDMLNATISFPIGDWSAVLGYSYNKNVGRIPSWSLTDLDRPWLPPISRQREEISRAFQLSLSRSATWRMFNASLSGGLFANRSPGGGNTYGGYVGVTLSMADPALRAGRPSTFTSAGVDMRTDRDRTAANYSLDRNWSWQGDTEREIALGVSGYGSDSLSGALQGRWNGRYGDAAASITNTYRSGESGASPSVTASYSSSFALARSGAFLGGSASQSDPLAGFVVRVAKHEEASGMAAEVSGGSSARIKVGFGQRTLLPVVAFSPVTVEVSDAGSSSSANGTSVIEGLGKQAMFMIPGQLMLRKVDAKVIYTYVGQAFDDNGKPLADSVVLNGTMPPLDEDGGFIVETDHKEDVLFLVNGPTLMRCPLQVKRRQDVLMVVGKVHCEVATPNALPEVLRKQARVQKLLEQRYVTSTQAPGGNSSGASH
ncbi:TcfC E-set like domain-containing protein [Stenotrophomonas indicatrix]|uniref:TcfC E-set like domain-containing protein n=1 Tax=Stenotrophomonas indicatrix TaxID=2045451 RepID=UPI00289789DC|nr:TcfC E-set like domain-containing protein [Stenotrophomonas indicatrix]